MIESLADQWMRAQSKLSGMTGHLMAWSEALAEVLALPLVGENCTAGERTRAVLKAMGSIGARLTLTGEALEEQKARLLGLNSPKPIPSFHADQVRAVRAEIDVTFHWFSHTRGTASGLERRDEDVAIWAAETITRKRVEMPALKAEPTPQQLADWMERFAKALNLALVRVEMVRVPSNVVGGMVDLRAGNIGRTERSPRDASGRTFSSVDLEHWKLAPTARRQLAMHLPLEGKPTKGSDVRVALDAGFIRAYLAAWALTDDPRDNPHGLFEWDPRHVLLELCGLPPNYTTVRGKKYARAPVSAERELQASFAALQHTLLEGIGDVEPSRPQALVSFYRDAKDSRRVYQHAPMAWIAAGRHFVQVPRAVLHLDTREVPLALGVARLLRDRARDMIRGPGHHRATLQQLARDVGEDVSASTRDRGSGPYYRTLAARLGAVVAGGQLGALHLEGEGPKAIATLTSSDALATVYQSLARDFPAPSLEASVAERMGRPRKTGRPRKPPR